MQSGKIKKSVRFSTNLVEKCLFDVKSPVVETGRDAYLINQGRETFVFDQDLFGIILSHLSPSELLMAARVNKLFYRVAKKVPQWNEMWQLKLKRHFPHIIAQPNFKPTTASAQSTYKEISNVQFAKLALPIKHIITLAKNGNLEKMLEACRTHKIKIEGLQSEKDASNYSAADWAAYHKHWHVLNDFYIQEKAAMTAEGKSVSEEEQLELAMRWNKLTTIKKLMNKGIRFTNEIYPLHTAIKRCDIELMTFLLMTGEDSNKVNNMGQTPLGLAICTHRAEVLKALLSCSDKIENKIDVNKPCIQNGESISPLLLALHQGDQTIIQLLLDNSNVNITEREKKHAYSILHLACHFKLDTIVKKIIELPMFDINSVDDRSWNSLMYSVNQGDLKIVKTLLSHANIKLSLAQTNLMQTNVIMLAVKQQSLTLVHELLTHHNSQETIVKCINDKDSDGWSALMHASFLGNVEIVNRLLQLPSIDINNKYSVSNRECTEHMTPFRLAGNSKSPTANKLIASLLADERLELDIENKMDCKVLRLAVKAGLQKEVSAYLFRLLTRQINQLNLAATSNKKVSIKTNVKILFKFFNKDTSDKSKLKALNYLLENFNDPNLFSSDVFKKYENKIKMFSVVGILKPNNEQSKRPKKRKN